MLKLVYSCMKSILQVMAISDNGSKLKYDIHVPYMKDIMQGNANLSQDHFLLSQGQTDRGVRVPINYVTQWECGYREKQYVGISRIELKINLVMDACGLTGKCKGVCNMTWEQQQFASEVDR